MIAVRTLYRLMSGKRRRQLLFVFALMILGVLADLVTIGAVVPFLASAAGAEPHGQVPGGLGLRAFGPDPLLDAAILLTAAAIAAAAIRLLLTRMSQALIADVGHDLAVAIFSRALRQDYPEHSRRHSSEVLGGLEKAQAVTNGMLLPMLQAAIGMTTAAFVTSLLFFIDPVATALAAGAVLLAYVIVASLNRGTIRANSRVIARMVSLRTKTVQESLGAIRDIILDGSHAAAEARFNELDRQRRDAVSRNAVVAASPRFLLEAIGVIALAGLTLLVSRRPGGVVEAIPTLGALAVGIQRLLPAIQQAWHGLSSSAGNLQSLLDVAALIEKPLPEPVHAAPLPFEDRIALVDLCFSYGAGAGADAVRGVSLEIPRGARVGIGGPTGSGKSTLIDLLMGFVTPSSGSIRIDGRPLDRSNLLSWQAGLTHVPQSIFLADDSIAANIALSRAGPVDRDRVRAAATAACLDEFLATLPDGLETRVGERGTRLSGGQRQRIGIARALYREAQVLILDEATNALDEATEDAVLAPIVAPEAGRTVFIVSHRPAVLARCDFTIRLLNGLFEPQRAGAARRA